MFDYGVPEEDIARPVSNLKVWPTEGERVALVDADAIAYVIGYTSDMQQYFKYKRAVAFNAGNLGRLNAKVWDDKIDHANWILNKWISQAGCDSAKLYLTNGEKNFRLKIAVTTPYKGQRIEEKPPFFYEIRDWLSDVHGAIMSDCCEADDEISIEAWRRHLAFDSELWTSGHRKFSDFVVVSGDKDLGIIPGWRCPPSTGILEWVTPIGELNPVWRVKEIKAYEYWPLFSGSTKNINHCSSVIRYKNKLQIRDADHLRCPKDKWEMDYVWWHSGIEQDTFSRGAKKGKGKFKRVAVGTKKSEYIHKLKGTGLKFFYSQLLTGDTVDNYHGLPGVGDTKAYEVLDNAKSETELCLTVKQLYQAKYGENWKKMLTEQGQLAHMQTRRNELWQVPEGGESTFPA